jgi:hypothetical protein
MITVNGIPGFLKRYAVLIITMIIIGIFLLLIDYTQIIITPEEALGSVIITFVVVWSVSYIYKRLIS